MTDEARVLKQMRVERGLSMRGAGNLMGWSDTYVSHIENGRVDVPEGERLDKILIAYGGITKKSFIEKIRRFRVEQTPLDDLNELIPRLTRDQLQAVIAFSMQLLQIPRFDGMTK
jgi:transcriptional regulator with XRE-family HTH domain